MSVVDIQIKQQTETTWEVALAGPPQTNHLVMVSPDYHQKLTGGRASEEELVKRSVEFLLAREPNTSIMEMFDLPIIQAYFPEYERTMQTTFG